MTLAGTELGASAVISECGKYRYLLSRSWDEALPSVTFIMLNPSTADASQDDPTIRRCIGFARSWGYGSLAVVNLFAYRSTDPKALKRPSVRDPVGPENDRHILLAAQSSELVVAAWGDCNWRDQAFCRAVNVLLLLRDYSIYCLGLTKKNGKPRHPLYVNANQAPVLFYERKDSP